jgi:hypothetical protein
MRYRFNFGKMMLFINGDEKERKIHRIELEGELPLLIADAKRKTASLWMLSDDMMCEQGFDAHGYNQEEEDTHIWKWYNKNGDVLLRVVIFNPNENDDVGQVVIAVGESGEKPQALLNFMTDFGDWNFLESYGDVEGSLTELGIWFRDKTP